MIPRLLWRCPNCQTDDALSQHVRWWQPDRLRCRTCGIVWEVDRVSGDDYRLRVVEGPLTGQEAPLAQWYDRMKRGLTLTPMSALGLDLEAGEVLWGKSKRVKLFAERQGEKGLYVSRKSLGIGQLFLTNERLIWRDTKAVYSLRLRNVIAVWAIEDWRLGIQLRDESGYRLRFLDESLLKWLTYIGLAAQQLEATCGHQILVSNY